MTALRVLTNALRANPSRTAVTRRGEPIPAGLFLARANAHAVHLRSAGLNEGDVLGIAAPDNVVAMQLVLASWMCGASVLVIDPRLSEQNLREWHVRMQFRFVAGRRARSNDGPEILPIPEGLAPLDELPWEPPANGDLVADHFLSSGTTGFPRIKPVTQGGLAERIEGWLAGLEREASGAMLLPLSVAYPASRAVWYRKLASGKTLVVLDPLFSISELDAALASPDVGECALAPVLIRRLLQLPDRGAGPRYPHLHRLHSVGGPATAEDKLGAVTRLSPNYRMTYSSTECGLIARIEGAEVLERPASCGRPMAGLTVEIRDGERVCETGEIGTIRVLRDGSGPVEPGDLGWLDGEGYLFIAGRSDGLMCRNGINVSVAQVERVLLACGYVADAVAWPTPDEDAGDRINAAVECPPEAEAEVARFIRRSFSHQDRPDRVVYVRRLPRGPSGKPDRRAIAAGYDANAKRLDA